MKETKDMNNKVNDFEESVGSVNIDKVKVKKKKKKKIKSFVGRCLAQENKPNAFLMIIEFIMCFFLDILRILKNLILGIVTIGIIACIVGAIIVVIKITPYYNEYRAMADEAVSSSTKDTFRISESSYIYDKDGNILAKLKASMDSAYLTYDEIPAEVIDAFVAVEDRTFWENPGIDIKGLVRIAVDAVKTKGEEVHGASTITQQLARNIFLTHEVSIERKAKEMLIAIELTQKYSKQDIMEFYVNDICYANAYYGIEAASIGYFNKKVDELSLSEIAYLCAIPNSPTYYDPYKNPERALTRRDKILGDMLELEYITQAEYDKAIKEEIVITRPDTEFNNYETTYAIDCAVKYLMKLNDFEFVYEFDSSSEKTNYTKRYNEAYEDARNELYSGGYKVYTTIDSEKQQELQEILNEKLSFNTEVDEETGLYKLQGAMTVIDNGSGKVVAIIGGRYEEGDTSSYSLNRAYQSPRQPGSSIKPLIVYAPAIELKGYTPESIVTNIDVTKAKEKGVDIDSLGGDHMTLRRALELSKNGVAWKLFYQVTPKVGLKYITNMEFASIVPDDYYNSAALGGLTYGATTTEMAGAYATLANHGEFRTVTCIDTIIDKYGNDIYEEYEEKQIYKKQVADTMIDMMKGVITSGTASGLKWSSSTKVEAAAKTGTTNDNKDGWLCGMTPYYTIAVWVGYDTPQAMPTLWGSSYPGQIWKAAMLNMLGDINIGQFINAEYDEDDIIERSDSYYSYLEGRDDSEVLSDGYTVGDYRNDRVIGESVDSALNAMISLDRNSANFNEQLESKRNEVQAIINTIYSRKYTAEKQAQLDTLYQQMLGVSQTTEETAAETTGE